jgi:hypothetical protein
VECKAPAGCKIAQDGAQAFVGCDAASNDEMAGSVVPKALNRQVHGPRAPIRNGRGDRVFESGGDVGNILIFERCLHLSRSAHRCLETGKGKVRLGAANHGAGEFESCAVAGARRLLDSRSTGKAEAKQLGGLVKGFAQRIVNGGTEALVVSNAAHDQELRVTA